MLRGLLHNLSVNVYSHLYSYCNSVTLFINKCKLYFYRVKKP